MANPYFSRSSVKGRQTIQQLVDMAGQRPAMSTITIRQLSEETLALGWEGILLKMKQAATAVRLEGWASDKGAAPSLILYPAAMLRYSQGRLNPTDAFGRRVMDLFRVLSNPERTVESTTAMSRGFARAQAALEAFSLEMASQAGKTGRDYPVLTLRMLDWVLPGQYRISHKTADLCGLRPRQEVWAMRHPLPTRVKVTVVIDNRVPEGCVLMSPVDCQEGPQADADGDQVIAIPDWEGSNETPVCGHTHARDGLAGLETSSLVGWLKPGKLSKLRFNQGLLKVETNVFTETVHQLAAYSVSGIGQVGYSPSLAMSVLALVGVEAFKPLAAFGFRRLYEDMLLAGLTPERWSVFRVARDLKAAGPLHKTLKAGFETIGLSFSDAQIAGYVVARAITSAASALENGAEEISGRLLALMGEHDRHVHLYGLVRAIDAGRLDSVFLPQWEQILAEYDSSLPLIRVLGEICPIMLDARQTLIERQQRAEYVTAV